MDHIVGKAIFTYFSWDYESWMPRFGRILNPIEDDEVFREQTVMQQLSDSTTVHRRRPAPPTTRRPEPPVVSDATPSTNATSPR
jgi:signal peptidase I